MTSILRYTVGILAIKTTYAQSHCPKRSPFEAIQNEPQQPVCFANTFKREEDAFNNAAKYINNGDVYFDYLSITGINPDGSSKPPFTIGADGINPVD